jgi:hypothetical protein
MVPTVSKGIVGLRQLQRPHHRPMRYRPKRHDNAAGTDRGKLASQVLVAAIHFGGGGLVLGRQALDRIGDTAVPQYQAVVLRRRDRSVREAIIVERLIEQDAGMVAGERTSTGIGAVHAGGETDHEQVCLRIPEGWDWARIIGRILAVHLLQVAGQPCASATLRVKMAHVRYSVRLVALEGIIITYRDNYEFENMLEMISERLSKYLHYKLKVLFSAVSKRSAQVRWCNFSVPC